ncbi:MAG: hypothetical protein AAFR36_31740, partial [Bacteroidota bacterium]
MAGSTSGQVGLTDGSGIIFDLSRENSTFVGNYTLSRPLVLAELINAGLDPLAINTSVGAGYTTGNGIAGWKIEGNVIANGQDGISEIEITLSGSAAAVGGSGTFSLVPDSSTLSGWSVAKAAAFGGLNIILGAQGQLLGFSVGKSGQIQAGYFLDWQPVDGVNSSIGIEMTVSQGLLFGGVSGNGGISFDTTNLISDVSQLTADQAVDLFTTLYDNGINPVLEPSTLEKFLNPLVGLLSVIEPLSERRQAALDRFLESIGLDSCFGPKVAIDMWPLDPTLAPEPANPHRIYDQEAIFAKTWKKPINQIEVGDIVLSFDDKGNMVPGYVQRIFQNDAKILLNFHGTRVTPGHVYYRADSKKSHKFELLIDILRDDGVIQHQDGTLIRAATNVPVDSPRDGFVK